MVPAVFILLIAGLAAPSAQAVERSDRFEFWVGVRPELAISPILVSFALGIDGSTGLMFLPRGEIGFGGRVGRTDLQAVIVGGPIFIDGVTQGMGTVDFAFSPVGRTRGKVVDFFGGGRFSFNLLFSPDGVFPAATVGGSLGFQAGKGPRFRMAVEPGIVLPIATFSLGLSLGVNFI